MSNPVQAPALLEDAAPGPRPGQRRGARSLRAPGPGPLDTQPHSGFLGHLGPAPVGGRGDDQHEVGRTHLLQHPQATSSRSSAVAGRRCGWSLSRASPNRLGPYNLKRDRRCSQAKPALAGSGRTPPVKGVGEPCAGEPHARCDGGGWKRIGGAKRSTRQWGTAGTRSSARRHHRASRLPSRRLGQPPAKRTRLDGRDRSRSEDPER